MDDQIPPKTAPERSRGDGVHPKHDPAGSRRDGVVVVSAFALIFAFSTVDSAISPLVRELHAFFALPMERVLLLISWCTFGTVFGVLVGPALTASFPVSRLLACGVGGLLAGLGIFLGADGFGLALAGRLVSGVSSGLIASCMWWLTFYGVSKPFYQAMMTVLMSARPLATAIGVPAAGWLAVGRPWQTPFWVAFACILASGAVLIGVMARSEEGEKRPFAPVRLLADYVAAFRVPHAALYYIGFTVNRMCYFGFYAMSGIWFIRHYGSTLEQISFALFCIGLGEAVVNFSVPALVRRFGHRGLFLGSLGLSAMILPVFLGGRLPYAAAIAAITVFMMLDRIYCMAVVLTIPQMFPQAQNMTVFGSLNTLTAWAGLSAISWLQGHTLETLGLPAIQNVLVACFLVGSALIWLVQHRTVLAPQAPGRIAPSTSG